MAPSCGERIVVIGGSGHAHSVIGVIEAQGRYDLLGVLERPGFGKPDVLGYPVIGTDDDLPRIHQETPFQALVVAIGDNHLRMRVMTRIRAMLPGLPFATLIHPSAILARDIPIGEGSVLMAGTILNRGASIGTGCILNTGARLDHDSIMQPYSSLAPGTTIGGGTRIGLGSAIGIGATVAQDIVIGDHTVIGAGAVVLKDVAPLTVAYGVPARPQRSRSADEKYM